MDPAGGSARGIEVSDRAGALPLEIAFLATHEVPLVLLRRAAVLAAREKVSAERALIAHGFVDAERFYRALALYLDVPFVKHRPRLSASTLTSPAIRKGVVRLAATEQRAFLAAPSGPALRNLLRARQHRRRALGDLAVTTPDHLARIVRETRATALADIASHALPNIAPHLSARGKFDRTTGCAGAAVLALTVLGGLRDWHMVGATLGTLFLASMTFRLLVGAAGAGPPDPVPVSIGDAHAPFYSVLVPLYREDAIVGDLIDALKAIDYPRSKLEVLILTEADDERTRTALYRHGLPPFITVVIVPDGIPRTKPRALNVGLALARGALLTVYDAEDRPDPLQLRRAASVFQRAGAKTGCLQARLAIGNGAMGVIPALFAIEYAALFDLFNVGIGRCGLPMALGGTSNHFRVSVLRRIGGWDAWNVTEDADLGFRLARCGYEVRCLNATTLEDAPYKADTWFKQRRRWMKGWMQTLVVLARDPRTMRELGLRRTLVLAALLTNLVTGPLALPYAIALVWTHLATSSVAASRAEPALALCVLGLGVGSTLWPACVGIARRKLLGLAWALPLLPLYLLAISAAAWMGLLDLMRQPYHWHKTDHERVSRPKVPLGRGRRTRRRAAI